MFFRFLFIITILVSTLPTFAYIENNWWDNSNSTDLTALEKYTWNKSYERNNLQDRIERLEEQAFGAVQTGNLNERFENVKYSILNRPKNNYRSTLRNNLNRYYNGQLTGYTPSLMSNDTSGINYSRPQLRGYHPTYKYHHPRIYNGTTNSQIGTTSSIRILD